MTVWSVIVNWLNIGTSIRSGVRPRYVYSTVITADSAGAPTATLNRDIAAGCVRFTQLAHMAEFSNEHFAQDV